MLGGEHYRVWGHLEDSVRIGLVAVRGRVRQAVPRVPARHARRPRTRSTSRMTGLTAQTVRATIEAYDFGRVRRGSSTSAAATGRCSRPSFRPPPARPGSSSTSPTSPTSPGPGLADAGLSDRARPSPATSFMGPRRWRPVRPVPDPARAGRRRGHRAAAPLPGEAASRRPADHRRDGADRGEQALHQLRGPAHAGRHPRRARSVRSRSTPRCALQPELRCRADHPGSDAAAVQHHRVRAGMNARPDSPINRTRPGVRPVHDTGGFS